MSLPYFGSRTLVSGRRRDKTADLSRESSRKDSKKLRKLDNKRQRTLGEFSRNGETSDIQCASLETLRWNVQCSPLPLISASSFTGMFCLYSAFRAVLEKTLDLSPEELLSPDELPFSIQLKFSEIFKKAIRLHSHWKRRVAKPIKTVEKKLVETTTYDTVSYYIAHIDHFTDQKSLLNKTKKANKNSADTMQESSRHKETYEKCCTIRGIFFSHKVGFQQGIFRRNMLILSSRISVCAAT